MIVPASAIMLMVEFVMPWSHVKGKYRFIFGMWLAWLVFHVVTEWATDDIAKKAVWNFGGTDR